MHKVGVHGLYLFYPHSMADQPLEDFLQQYRAHIVYRKTLEPDCVCACALDQNQDGGHFFCFPSPPFLQLHFHLSVARGGNLSVIR